MRKAVLVCLSIFAQAICAESLAYPTAAVMDPQGIPFILDDAGDVWAFDKPFQLEGGHRLKGLKNIKELFPLFALDQDNRMFNWTIEPSSRSTSPEDLSAEYTPAMMISDLPTVKAAAVSRQHYLALDAEGRVFEWGRPLTPQKTNELLPLQIIDNIQSPDLLSTSGLTNMILTSDGIIHEWGLILADWHEGDESAFTSFLNARQLRAPPPYHRHSSNIKSYAYSIAGWECKCMGRVCKARLS